MADNIELNAGSGGATLATDDAGAAGHVQLVKLAISADGSATPIDGTTANGLEVDVTRVIPGTSATHLGKAVDSAAGLTDTGVAILAVRDDALGGLTPVEGDYVPVHVDANGALWIAISSIDQLIGRVKITDGTDVALVSAGGAVLVDASATTQPVSHAALTELAAAIDTELQVDVVAMPNVTLAAGTNTNEVVGDVAQDAAVGGNPVLVGGRASAAAPTDMSADGDSVYLWTTLKGALNVADGGGTLSIDDGGGNITVDGTVAVTNAGLTALNGAIAGTEVQVDVLTMPSTAVTNAGTFAVQVDGAALTALQLLDDAVFAEDVAASAADKGLAVLAVRRDADTTLVDTTGDYANLQVDANGRLKVEAFSGEALPVTLTSTTVTGTVAVTQSGTWDEVGINDSGNSITVDAPVGTPVFVRLSDGGSAIATLPVSLAAVPSHAVTNAGTFAVQVDGSALTALQLIDDTVKTDDTAFTPATDKVLMVGAQADEGSPDAVDEGDAGALRMTLSRGLHVNLRDASGAEVSVGGGTQYDEDTASASAQKLTMAGVTRADTAASQVDTDGDRSTLIVDASGRLHANVGNTVAVSNAGLTELAAAINASSQMDVNIAASGATVPISHAALTELAAAIDTEMQVDIVGALPAGTNAIGKLAANSGVDIGDVDVTSLPALAAGTNLIGRVSASDETSTLYNGTTALTPKFAIIDAAGSGDNTLVAAVNPKKIRVHALFMVAAGTVNVRFESGASGTALSGQMNLIANTGFVLNYNPLGWFETASNTLLNLELSNAISVDGSLVYTEV